jgi:hypothetical protein
MVNRSGLCLGDTSSNLVFYIKNKKQSNNKTKNLSRKQNY